MLSEEQKIKNFSIFIKKLNEVGVPTSSIEANLKDKITNATYSMTNEYGVAEDGSLLNVILRVFTPYAIKINELLPSDMQKGVSSIVKVCLLHQLSKCEMFVANTNTWEIEKRGLLYKYAPYDYAFKMGMRSVILALENGITFNAEEIEAMTILDREPNDDQAKFHSNTLSVIIKQAMELTSLQLKKEKKNG